MISIIFLKIPITLQSLAQIRGYDGVSGNPITFPKDVQKTITWKLLAGWHPNDCFPRYLWNCDGVSGNPITIWNWWWIFQPDWLLPNSLNELRRGFWKPNHTITWTFGSRQTKYILAFVIGSVHVLISMFCMIMQPRIPLEKRAAHFSTVGFGNVDSSFGKRYAQRQQTSNRSWCLSSSSCACFCRVDL